MTLNLLKTVIWRVFIVLCVIVAIALSAWFVPAFMQEISGTNGCTVQGNIVVCWSVK